MSGWGKMTWNDGSSYTGNWHNNKRHGFGTTIYKNHKISKGIWRDDDPTGEFEIIMPCPDPILNRTIKISWRDLDDIIAGDDDESDAGMV